MNDNNTKPKKTVYDYVKPYAHRPIPKALDNAKNDYYQDRASKSAIIAVKPGATQAAIVRELQLDPALINRWVKEKTEWPDKIKSWCC